MNKRLKILLLEDSPDDVGLIKLELERADIAFTSTVVKKRNEFEAALWQFEPDVILADHALPQFNSIEAFDLFCKYRTERNVSIPFILVTGHVSEEFAIRMLKAGVDDYVLKSGLKRLPPAIENAVEKCRAENDRERYHNRIVRMESLMREAEQLAHFGSWDADLVTGQYIWSDELYRIYGYEPGEVVPSTEFFLSMVHPDDVGRLRALRAEALEKLGAAEYEFRIIDRRGIVKHLSCKLTIRRNAEGKAVRLTGFNVDVTERVHAQQALRVNEQVYRSLFEQNPDVVFSVDKEGRFTDANDVFAALVGLTVADLRGRDFRTVLQESEFERVYPYMLSALERNPQRYQSNFVDSQGKKVLLDVTVMPIVVDGMTVGVHCIAKNLTEPIRIGGESAVRKSRDGA